MTARTRRRIHLGAAIFFGIQIPPALYMQLAYPAIFEVWWKQYLIFLSIYAIVVGHLSAVSAELPTEEDA